MPEKNPSAGRGDKPFADYLRQAPEAREVTGPVTMVGAVMRSSKNDQFILMTGGQTIELPVAAVESYRIVQETGTQKILELKLDPARIRDLIAKGPIDTIKEAPIDTIKEQPKDPIIDTIKEQPWDTIKEQPFDTVKELTKDPIQDPITIQEVIGPGKQLGDPIDPGQFGTIPFVMATPHHAPPEVIARQAAAAGLPQFQAQAQAQAATAVALDMVATIPTLDQPQTVHFFDQPHTTPLVDIRTFPYFDQQPTIKELTKDPIQDPITWVEVGGGTLVEQPGGGYQPPQWNLPGMMF
ncbi:MAG TPA: hypothetical protein PLL30_09330 [Candidatus Krumholzibacteria bacterium]|nr:hypothetical protein [Candidatus Krumholzibacteria bacterium]HPD71963.1 hypothetical protein [Candidatus Krumholzibacteria bacterium]HRY41104.1 hypothetical protein [Candidatus Krumholzibacteria bacterium]